MPELQLVAGERVLGSFENFLFLARMEPLKYFLTIWTLWHVFQADACGLHFGNASVPAGVGAAWETDSCFFFFFVPISSDFRAGAAALASISTIHWSGLCCFQLRNCYLPGGGKKQSGSRCTLRQCTGICSSCHSSARNIFPSVGELSSTWAGLPVLELVLAWSLPCLCTGLLHLIRLY